MTTRFKSRWAADFEALLRFKRSLGYRYARGEFTLREFDRFLLRSQAYQRRAECLDQAILAWLAGKPHRKSISVSADASVLRQFCLYLRRCPGRSAVREPRWPRLPTESTFVPYILSKEDIRRLLQFAAQLTRPAFRAVLYRALLLLLYCTGLRFGEALRFRMRDVDTRAGVSFCGDIQRAGSVGGVFAPSLIVGGGVGAVYARVWHHFLPHLVGDPAFYALVAMAATFGGIARALFTAIIFLFELSRNPNALLPLVVCCMVSDGFVRLFSAESIMTGKLIKRGLIVRQDYRVPMLLRGRIEEVMRKNFTVIKADDDVQAVVREVSPEQAGVLSIVEPEGNLAGIVEAHDLLRGVDRNPKVRDIMRHDYIAAHVGETVDEVMRRMVVEAVENIAVVEGDGLLKPIGGVRAADILRLRRWEIDEEGFRKQSV